MTFEQAQKRSYTESLQLLQAYVESSHLQKIICHPKKHKLLLTDIPSGKSIEFRLPLPMPRLPDTADALPDYVEQLPPEIPACVILLIQAGATALGYFDGGEVMEHKAIKKYMKRHKRGKAQITYLNKKGKSKAGSRIRLANTIRFLEEINERLQEWEEDYEPARILYSCSAQLWGMLFQSKVSPPFAKKDPRLLKIPTHIHLPSHEELLRINRFANYGWVSQNGE